MKIKAIIHEAEGKYWAEVHIFSGCHTQGETIEEIIENLKEVINLYTDDQPEMISESDRIVELTI